jgi:hypothetical protein
MIGLAVLPIALPCFLGARQDETLRRRNACFCFDCHEDEEK